MRTAGFVANYLLQWAFYYPAMLNPAELDFTWVGTTGYMPPPPEPPGTPAADIHGLGMVLSVISTGCKPSVFPELAETLVNRELHPDFNLLSPVIFHACHPDRMKRPTAIEMKEALLQVERKLRVSSQPAPEPL